jgi:hypothetical protein
VYSFAKAFVLSIKVSAYGGVDIGGLPLAERVVILA